MPSQGTLESEFGTSDEDTVIRKILESGSAQEMNVREHRRFPLRRCSLSPTLFLGLLLTGL